MRKYKIYCTQEQTKKSLNLGAPLEIGEGKGTILCRLQNFHTYKACVIPTAEEMIGWLEEQGVSIEIRVNQRTDGVTNFVYNVICGSYASLNNEVIFFDSRKEATLAAIDAALEYLANDYLVK